MKIFRSYNKFIYTFLILYLFSSFPLLFILSILSFSGTLIIASSLLVLIVTIIFEVQKSKVAKSLALRLFPTEINTIFLYDNGVSLDFFENILILNRQAIVICTFHNLALRKWNTILKKDSILEIILHKNINSIKLNSTSKKIVIQFLNRKYEINSFNYLKEFETLLVQYNYEEMGSEYVYVGLDR